jgi:PAS domain S-box-containing protein
VAERTADLERMNRNLHESEVRFRMAVNHLPDAFVIYDAQRRIQFVNAAGLTLTERLIEDFLGRTDEEIHPPTVTDAYLHCSSGQSKRKAIKQENARLLYQTVRPIRS